MIPTPNRDPGLLRRWILPGLAILLVVGFHFSPFGVALDRAFLDASSRHPLRAPPLPMNSAIVLIDDATMDAAGRELPAMRWPFPRWVFAGLIAALDRAGAKEIVFDFTFLEPSESSEHDLLLAAVAAGTPTILASTEKRGAVFWEDAFIRAHPSWFSRPRQGQVDFHADDDGVSRRYPATGSLGAVAARPPHVHANGLIRWHGGIDQLKGSGGPEAKVQVLSAKNFMIRGIEIMKRVTDAAPDYSATAIANALSREPMLNDKELQRVTGRTVFVGASASGTFDLKSTPVGPQEPGVLIHWTAWTNLVGNGFISIMHRGWSLALGAAVALAVLGGAMVRPGISLAGVMAATLAVAVLATAYMALSLGWFFPPATPVVASVVTLLGVAAESFWRERQRKLEIQAMFGSYVAPSVVDRLVRDPQAILLGGEKREATVFFCDLVGFTDLSEKIPPELLLEIINRYLQVVSDSLMEYDAYVDKYIGDAVMAVFGVPEAVPNHALAACKGALAAQRVFDQFSDDVARQHGHRPRMRIGINTGEMIVGNVGSERKKSYTVLGDAVNLASRLEGANKEFGTSIMLGEATARRVQEYLVTRPLTRLRVKGKTEAIEVHELVGDPLDLDPARQEFISAYRQGYTFFGSRQFAAAAEALTRANTAVPGDRVTLALLAQATEYAMNPPAPDWQPILSLDSK